jgi:cell wall-associated NlpC family hydrolase
MIIWKTVSAGADMPSQKPDPRLNPWRDDLAAAHLRGEVDAPKFVDGVVKQVSSPVATLRRSPADGAMQDSQLLYGETFRIFETKNGWAWGQAEADDYVGYVPENAFAATQDVTHRLAAQRSFIYRDRDIKSRPLMAISLGARLSVVGQEDGFAELAHGGFLYAPHMAALDDYESDPIAVARRFIGAPYFWGGREAIGLDCSALVQAALVACGFACPRDSDMQQAALGQIADKPSYGDLVFWKGHVGFIAGDNLLLHANAHHMAVAEEPFDEACARIQAAGGGAVTAIKRL